MIGRTVSHYKVLDVLGQGGMGTVYLAEDTSLARKVALKMLPQEMASQPDRLRRFQREAKAVATLNHPGIVTIYSVEESEHGHFIAMELVTGKSLEDLIGPTGFPLDRFLDIAIPLADALGVAHEQGITHRDLKPANVMVNDEGRVKILDFGLAKLQAADPTSENTVAYPSQQLTQEGVVVGTMPYMSPEQVQGRRLDHRTDIFSLGVLLYEMATGVRPFKGESSAELVSSILRDSPSPLVQAKQDLPEPLDQIVTRCLEKDPDRRYQGASDLRNDLEALKDKSADGELKLAPSIAVLPFADLSPEKDQDYFCEGLAEELINALVKLEGLRVVSRASAFQIVESISDVREIGRHLNAETVLGGSVRKAGNRVRITAQLTNVSDGYHIWSERYDGNLEDVFAIQDEIAQNIVQAMQVTLTPAEERGIEASPKVDVLAFDYYLKGRKYYYQWRRPSFDFARQMFARATVIDPGFSRAYAAVADCCSFLYTYFERSEENLKEADAASRRATEFDPDSAEAHASRGLALSLSKRFDDAKTEFETALRLDPKSFEAHYYYARSSLAQGDHAQAADLFSQASESNPEDFESPSFHGMALGSLGRVEESLDAYRKALANAKKHLELNPDDARAVNSAALCFIHLGDREEALSWADRATRIEPDNPSIAYNVACVFALLGEPERALDGLEQSITMGWGQREWIENDSDLDSLRDLPRFQELVASLPG